MTPSDYEDKIDWKNLSTNTTFDGVDDVDEVTSPNNKVSPVRLDKNDKNVPSLSTSLLIESLIQQLCLLLKENKDQAKILYDQICEKLSEVNLIQKTYAMTEFDAVRTQYRNALQQLAVIPLKQHLPSEFNSRWPLVPKADYNAMQWSQYCRDFEEIKLIGRGGFGKVYRSRHKLDDVEYAIKKVQLNKKGIDNVYAHLSEVQTIAMLNHIRIVPYKSAWFEPLYVPNINDRNNQSNDIIYDDTSEEDETDNMDEEDDEQQKYEEEDEEVEEEEFVEAEEINDIKNLISEPHVNINQVVLYIQMKLCDETLRVWLDKRNEYTSLNDFYKKYFKEHINFYNKSKEYLDDVDNMLEQQPLIKRTYIENCINESFDQNNNSENNKHHWNIVMDILCQLVEALIYLKSHNIVHHDIKPSNIFISIDNGKLLVQLGDFGLACPQKMRDLINHTENMDGTYLYAAPEQLNGICNPKNDIYSLGVILIELLICFKTDMERYAETKIIKSGKIPEDLPNIFVKLLNNMLSPDYEQRFDVEELQKIINKYNSDLLVQKLEAACLSKDYQIKNLKQQFEMQELQLSNKDAEISRLMELLKDCSINNNNNINNQK